LKSAAGLGMLWFSPKENWHGTIASMSPKTETDHD
jgi:hypothetical protein